MFCYTEDAFYSIFHWLLFRDRHKSWFYTLCHYQELIITERTDHQNWTQSVFHHLKPDGSDSSAVFGSRWTEFILTDMSISSVSVSQMKVLLLWMKSRNSRSGSDSSHSAVRDWNRAGENCCNTSCFSPWTVKGDLGWLGQVATSKYLKFGMIKISNDKKV